jgi:hypothetical protein
MLQGLPLNSGLSAKVSDGFISMLWQDLPHPSPTHAGPSARYRKHDGSGNNPHNPNIGKAGSPYARNVPPSKPKGKHCCGMRRVQTTDIPQDPIYQMLKTYTRHC